MELFLANLLTPSSLNVCFTAITSLVTVGGFLLNLRKTGRHREIIESLNKQKFFSKQTKEQNSERELVLDLLDTGTLLFSIIKEKMYLIFVFSMLGIFGLYELIDINFEGSAFAGDPKFENFDSFFVGGQIALSILNILNVANPFLSKDEKAFLVYMLALKEYFYDEVISHYLNDINANIKKINKVAGKRAKLIKKAEKISNLSKNFVGKSRKRFWKFWKKGSLH